jgi:GAF domain-containing protein
MIAPMPINETARLAALERYGVLDTPPEVIFDQFAGLTAGLLNVPIAMVGLIDQERHWFKSAVGSDMSYNSRENSFCQFTILEDKVLCIPDTLVDDQVKDILPVTLLGVRFYAGAPLTTPDGFNIGTVCVFDYQPRNLEPSDVQTLELLAKRVMEALNDRLEHGVRTDSRDVILASVLESLGLESAPLFGQAFSEPEEVLEDADVLARVSQAVPQKTPSATLEQTIFERIKTLPAKPALARVVRYKSEILLAHAFGNAPDGFVWQTWAFFERDPKAVPLEAFVASASFIGLPKNTRMIGLSQETRGAEHLVPSRLLALGRI